MSLSTLLALMLATFAPPDWQAPADALHLVPRLEHDTRRTFANLRYEGNNRALRGPEPRSTCGDAENTRALAARTAGLFVLRDALFSQQDHPIDRPSCALMMPMNWVSGAVDDVMHGRTPTPVTAPPLADDAAWASLTTPESMFGGFQASEALHGWAVRDRAGATVDDVARIENARAAVHTLATAANALILAAPRGARAVAEAGAELIADSDASYFDADIRRAHVIPLMVENPSAHEIDDEHKGLQIAGRTLDPAAVALTREVVYRRRLDSGPIALERYDITKPADVAHLLEVLAMLVPPDEAGHRVYVWVGGALIPGSENVEDVHERMGELTAAIAAAPIAHDRVTVFARPVFQTRRSKPADLEAASARAGAQHVLYGVNMTGAALRSWMRW